MVAEATIKLKVNGNLIHTVSEGSGPVDALNNALLKALINEFPILKTLKLTDFRVRVIDERSGTKAKVRVLITMQDEESNWSTIGVSENIIAASWEALVDGIDYKLQKE